MLSGDAPSVRLFFSQAGATALRRVLMTEDDRDVHDALASHADTYEIRRELHSVPPHAVYEVTVDGTRAVCKVARAPQGNPAAEGQVIRYVGQETGVPVPRILAVGDDYFLAEWHDDAPESDEEEQESTPDVEKARAMGAGLATLHEQTAFDAPGFPRATENGFAVERRDSWNDTVSAFLADRHKYLDYRGYGDIAAAAQEFVREHEPLADAGEPVLCHGNYLSDHVTVVDGRVTCVIDFEHALVGPGEYDYWRTSGPCFDGPFSPSREIQYSPEHKAFRKGYEAVRPLPEGFERQARVYWMVNAVAYLQALFLQRNVTGTAAARRAEQFREYAFELLDALRKTFE